LRKGCGILRAEPEEFHTLSENSPEISRIFLFFKGKKMLWKPAGGFRNENSFVGKFRYERMQKNLLSFITKFPYNRDWQIGSGKNGQNVQST